jgi:hypothetical protein
MVGVGSAAATGAISTISSMMPARGGKLLARARSASSVACARAAAGVVGLELRRHRAPQDAVFGGHKLQRKAAYAKREQQRQKQQQQQSH